MAIPNQFFAQHVVTVNMYMNVDDPIAKRPSNVPQLGPSRREISAAPSSMPIPPESVAFEPPKHKSNICVNEMNWNPYLITAKAQPTEAVVPVARAAQLLGQRGGRCGDDAPRRRIGQSLQRDQRASDDLGVLFGAPAGARPRPPEFFREPQRVVGIHWLGKWQVGWDVRENERHPLPSRHGEVADRGQPLAPKLDRRAEEQHVRARNREEIACLAAWYPLRPTAA